jgi:hypothetical protein
MTQFPKKKSMKKYTLYGETFYFYIDEINFNEIDESDNDSIPDGKIFIKGKNISSSTITRFLRDLDDCYDDFKLNVSLTD